MTLNSQIIKSVLFPDFHIQPTLSGCRRQHTSKISDPRTIGHRGQGVSVDIKDDMVSGSKTYDLKKTLTSRAPVQ